VDKTITGKTRVTLTHEKVYADREGVGEG